VQKGHEFKIINHNLKLCSDRVWNTHCTFLEVLCVLKCYDKIGVTKRTLYDFVYRIVCDVRVTQL